MCVCVWCLCLNWKSINFVAHSNVFVCDCRILDILPSPIYIYCILEKWLYSSNFIYTMGVTDVMTLTILNLCVHMGMPYTLYGNWYASNAPCVCLLIIYVKTIEYDAPRLYQAILIFLDFGQLLHSTMVCNVCIVSICHSSAMCNIWNNNNNKRIITFVVFYPITT